MNTRGGYKDKEGIEKRRSEGRKDIKKGVGWDVSVSPWELVTVHGYDLIYVSSTTLLCEKKGEKFGDKVKEGERVSEWVYDDQEYLVDGQK